jgi:hypothetical protein
MVKGWRRCRSWQRKPPSAQALVALETSFHPLAEGAETGDLQNDVAPDELASYCLHELAAARSLPSKAAVRRLVTVTLAGLRPR